MLRRRTWHRVPRLLFTLIAATGLAGCSGSTGNGFLLDLAMSCGDSGCAQCEGDSQCRFPTPRCDKNSGACVPCLPSNDNCPAGQHCVAQNGTYACAAHCNSSAECPRTDGGVATSCCNAACVDTGSDKSNCGGCGMACPAFANASGACVSGTCAPGTCNLGFADCNGSAPDGCEINLGSDGKNCGACGKACPPAINGVGSCTAGACTIACNPGYLHCTANPADGCETNGNVDPRNCGSCGVACPGSAPHGTVGCVAGGCAMTSCDPGWGDCNKMAADGCETALATDAANCGMCGTTCNNLPNASATCAAGRCVLGMCKAGFADCDALPGNGCEAKVDADVRNCGACGRVCLAPNGTPGCVGGACSIAACNAGYADCNMVLGDGCEAQLASDAMNCGGCGKACPAPPNAAAFCANGQCGVGACKPGFADCDKDPMNGCEADLSSVKTCGSCNVACGQIANGMPGCKAGLCGVGSCNALFGDCNGIANDGCEKSLATDLNNCGGCGKVCAPANATPSCLGGVCGFLACKAGFGDCNGNLADGCEKNLNTDAANCGACGKACGGGTPNCVNGVCSGAACVGVVGANIAAVLNPALQYGACWYLSTVGKSCDAVCAGAGGGTNVALNVMNSFADDCNGGAANQPATWFFLNGNKGAWTGPTGAPTGYKSLGHGYSGATYYGKCSTGQATTSGTLPGTVSDDPTRAVVCACSK